MENKDTREFAKEIIRQLKIEKENIRRIHRKDYAAIGDKMRKKLVLASPIAYYHAVKLYDKYVIPLRSRA